MSFQNQGEIDNVDRKIIQVLQQDARASFSEIGRQVGLSQPTVAERVRRMEGAGVIRGYRVEVDAAKIGLPVTAFVRLKIPHPTNAKKKVEQLIRDTMLEVEECHSVTGDDCLLLKVRAASIYALSEITSKLVLYGDSHTSIVMGTAVEGRPPNVMHKNASGA